MCALREAEAPLNPDLAAAREACQRFSWGIVRIVKRHFSHRPPRRSCGIQTSPGLHVAEADAVSSDGGEHGLQVAIRGSLGPRTAAIVLSRLEGDMREQLGEVRDVLPCA